MPGAGQREVQNLKGETMKLQGKLALITGGSSGIGLETAKLFLQEGASVIITGRDEGKLKAACEDLGGKVSGHAVDITSLEALHKLAAAVSASHGKIDVLFANAGVAGKTPLGADKGALFDDIIRTNLSGVFYTMDAFAQHLSDGASVILNGSVHARLGESGFGAYAASKAGVRALGRVFASELAHRGIRVNLVTPGGTYTPIWAGIAPDQESFLKLEKRIARGIPLRRFGRAEEVAKAALFLACSDSSNMTAAEIVVDGGATGAPRGAPMYQDAV